MDERTDYGSSPIYYVLGAKQHTRVKNMPQGPKGERRPRDVIGNAVHVMRTARVQSSRRLEREAGRNVEVRWLTGRVVSDHNTIVDFRKDNGRVTTQLKPRGGMALPTDAQ